jgi:hypothetical protein
VCQAHITVIVSGPSNTEWTGYAFSNTGFEQSPDDSDDEGDDCRLDFFATDTDADDCFIDADIPYWDARSYWLQTVAIRCELVLREWLYLVHTIEERLQALVRQNYLPEY